MTLAISRSSIPARAAAVGVAGPKRVPGEQGGGQTGGGGAALDDRLSVSRWLAVLIAAQHVAEHRPAVDLGGRAPGVEPAELLVGLGDANGDEQVAGGIVLEVLGIERDELRVPERGGEAEQQRRAVPEPGQGGGVDRLEQPLKRIKLERFGLAHRAGAALPANPGNDRGHGARVTRVGMVRGAVTGGDRRRPAGDRHRAETRSASAARNVAAVSSAASIAWRARSAHQAANDRQSFS